MSRPCDDLVAFDHAEQIPVSNGGAFWRVREHVHSKLNGVGGHLADLLRTSQVERVIDKRLYALDEAHCMGQIGVNVKRRFILPA